MATLAMHYKPGKQQQQQRGRILFPATVLIVILMVAWSRSFPSYSGYMNVTGQVTVKHGLMTSATSSSAAQHPHSSAVAQQNSSEWDTHIIFDGNAGGKLEECPEDSSSWPLGTWVSEPTDSPGAGRMLPHTAKVQQLIWEHQHPEDCSTAKFLLYRNPRLGEGSHGVGSVLHLETNMLMLALNSGRVLAEVPGTYLTDHPYCGNRTTLDSCYFYPLTHCTITPEQVASAYHLNSSRGSLDQALFRKEQGTDGLPQFVSADKLFPQKSPLSHSIPRPFEGLLTDSGIPRKNAYYWWRSQAIAYIVRPNEQALQEIAMRKRDKLRNLPLSNGCVSVYIRHGDKHTEHKTYEDPEYEDALKELLQVDSSLTRQVFLSTEDPATVVFFTNATRNWSTSYVDMPRKPDRKKNNVAYMKEHGFAEEMLDGLLNLDLALQCDGFVSSINSNWARLIDELRSTVRCKAQAKYMDVGQRSPKGLFFWY